MTAQKKPSRLHEKFENAVDNLNIEPAVKYVQERPANKALQLAFNLAVFGFVQAVNAVDWVLNPAARQQRRQSKINRQQEHEDQVEAARRFREDVTEGIINHPSAPDIKTLTGERLRVEDVGRAISHVAMYSRRLMRHADDTEAREVVFSKEGHAQIPGQAPLSGAVQQLLEFVHQYSAPQAQALWSWLHPLAASGEAAHLFPRMKIEVRGQDIAVMRDEAYKGLGPDVNVDELPKKLWRQDRAEAEARRASPQPGLSANGKFRLD